MVTYLGSPRVSEVNMNQSEALSRCEQWFTAQVMHFVPRAVLSLSISDFSDDDDDEDDDDDDFLSRFLLNKHYRLLYNTCTHWLYTLQCLT